MINAVIGELEELLVRLAKECAPDPVPAAMVAKAFSPREWRLYEILAKEAGCLLAKRGVVIPDGDQGAFRYVGSATEG